MSTRIDTALHQRGLASSRTHARRIVEEGRALINGARARRASAPVGPDDRLDVTGAPVGGEYASRAAHKLAGALTAFHLDDTADGSHALDLGASTGGFTDVLLRAGARTVTAVDVGTGQLIERLRADERVRSLEQTDARTLSVDTVGHRPDLIVSDVSFISLTQIIPTISRVAADGADIVLMVKPQFEVGRGNLPKSGVVTDPALWRRAVTAVAEACAEHALTVVGVQVSTLPGQDGNREFFLHGRNTPPNPACSHHVCGMIDEAVERASGRGEGRTR